MYHDRTLITDMRHWGLRGRQRGMGLYIHVRDLKFNPAQEIGRMKEGTARGKGWFLCKALKVYEDI